MHPVGEGHSDYELLFSILDSLWLDSEKHSMIEHNRTEGDIHDIEADTEQMRTGVEIQLPMSHNMLDKRRGVYRRIGIRLKSEIAQLSLSDLGCISLVL
jgi:hypothetical protein